MHLSMLPFCIIENFNHEYLFPMVVVSLEQISFRTATLVRTFKYTIVPNPRNESNLEIVIKTVDVTSR